MTFLYFIFLDFWHFAGFLLIIYTIFNGIIGIINALKGAVKELIDDEIY